MSAQARADADCLDEIAREYRLRLVHVENGEAALDRAELRGLHDALKSRVLRQTLEALGLSMSEVGEPHLHELVRLLSHSGETDLPGGWTACAEGETLYVFRRPPDWGPIPIGYGAHLLPNGRRLTLRDAGKCSGVHNPFYSFLADRDRIDMSSLSVRRAAATDRIEIPGRWGARTVRRDCRIPRRMRRDLAALFDKNGLIAVEGIGLDRSRQGDEIEKIEIIFGGF